MKVSQVLLASVVLACNIAQAETTLYSQNFESPVGFVNDGGDINIFKSVNQLYGNQPVGFTFNQPFTTETLKVGGSGAFGTGYKDPSGIAGQYVVSMLSSTQNDLLSLSFNAGTNKFLNFAFDISSIDLDRFGGPFVATGGESPVFRVSLFDNPTGATTLAGNGVLLDSADFTGTTAPNKFTFSWTHAVAGLSTLGSTNGNVTMQIDLLSGGYAAMDNFQVVASDIKGVVPEPSYSLLFVVGATVLGALHRRIQS